MQTRQTIGFVLAALSLTALSLTAVGSAGAAQPAAAVVRRVPPIEAVTGRDLRLVAVIDNDWIEGGLVARYRPLGTDVYGVAPFRRSSVGGYYATIPSEIIARPGLEYFISAANGDTTHFANAGAPHLVRVTRPSDSAWREAELHRLGGRRYSAKLDVHYQSFGSSSGTDQYIKSEIDWSYRPITTLYSFSLGFGFLEGDTPADATEDAANLQRGYRYGYGGVRLRLRDAVWLDARASLGFGDNGFSPGGGGQVILGDDWRTCVKFGFDASSALSYHAWITLQWDTVPGVLMSATAATTNQPRSEIDSGSYVLFQVAKPINDRFAITGKLSYGGRGNRPGGPGAGIATEMRF